MQKRRELLKQEQNANDNNRMSEISLNRKNKKKIIDHFHHHKRHYQIETCQINQRRKMIDSSEIDIANFVLKKRMVAVTLRLRYHFHIEVKSEERIQPEETDEKETEENSRGV